MAINSNQEAKKHGDPLESLLEQVDTPTGNPVPMPDNGGHSKSHAAHLGSNAHEHTKPAGNLRQGSAPGELREPPMVVSRVGKEHRKQ